MTEGERFQVLIDYTISVNGKMVCECQGQSARNYITNLKSGKLTKRQTLIDRENYNFIKHYKTKQHLEFRDNEAKKMIKKIKNRLSERKKLQLSKKITKIENKMQLLIENNEDDDVMYDLELEKRELEHEIEELENDNERKQLSREHAKISEIIYKLEDRIFRKRENPNEHDDEVYMLEVYKREAEKELTNIQDKIFDYEEQKQENKYNKIMDGNFEESSEQSDDDTPELSEEETSDESEYFTIKINLSKQLLRKL